MCALVLNSPFFAPHAIKYSVAFLFSRAFTVVRWFFAAKCEREGNNEDRANFMISPTEYAYIEINLKIPKPFVSFCFISNHRASASRFWLRFYFACFTRKYMRRYVWMWWCNTSIQVKMFIEDFSRDPTKFDITFHFSPTQVCVRTT